MQINTGLVQQQILGELIPLMKIGSMFSSGADLAIRQR